LLLFFYRDYFELLSCLANYGNWAYFAGVGGDPKNRHFRTISQSSRYDPNGTFVRKWIDIQSEDVEAALRPWAFDDNWPTPIVDPESQLTFQDKERFVSEGRISST
jgi:deoxyribodipyrimidine photolyase